MRNLLGFVCFVLLAMGAGGLVHELIGWFDKWAVTAYLGFLDGYEVYVNIALIVLGLAVGAAEDSVKHRGNAS